MTLLLPFTFTSVGKANINIFTFYFNEDPYPEGMASHQVTDEGSIYGGQLRMWSISIWGLGEGLTIPLLVTKYYTRTRTWQALENTLLNLKDSSVWS
jgi:hypothetical protein